MMEKQTKIGTIPEGWKVKKLKEVFHINELSLPSNTDANYKFKYIPIEFVSTNHIDYGNCESFRFVDAPGRARRIVRENDILISGVRPNLKSFAVFKKPDDSNWICSTGFYVLTAKEESDNLFSYYELLSEIGESQFYSYVAGSNYPAIGDGDIRNMKLMFPKDKSEQSAIAAILSKVDEAIAAVQASISAAERLKKSLMQNLLTGRMKPDGTLRKEDEFYVDEKFGKVPLGWEVKKVSEIAENLDNLRKPIKSIDRDKIKGKIPYYGAAGIVDYINDYLFDGTYLLFGEDGENLLSRKLPQAFIVKGKFWVNNHAHILRVYDEFDINLIVNILESKKYDNIVYGSAQPKINKSDLNRIKIIIPKDIDEQKRISKSITTIDIEISTKQNKIAVLERLKKSLMQNLLTGRVRILLNK